MKQFLFTFFLFFFSFSCFAEPKEIKFNYKFKNSKSLEAEFPFLVNTGVFESFIDYEDFAKENKILNEVEIAEFKYNNNLYYLMTGYGMDFCGSAGCYFEIFSKKDNKVIATGQTSIGDAFIDNNLIYFQYQEGIHNFKYILK